MISGQGGQGGQSGKDGQTDASQIVELDALRRLHGMASRFVREGNLAGLLSDAIDAAMAIAGADLGFIATLTGIPVALKVAAHRGCERPDASGPLRSFGRSTKPTWSDTNESSSATRASTRRPARSRTC